MNKPSHSERYRKAGIKVDLTKTPPKMAPHPEVRTAVRADLLAAGRAARPDASERAQRRRGVRMLLTDRATQALVAYRYKVHFAGKGRSSLAHLAHWVAVVRAGTCIGPIVLDAGVRIPEGKVILGGRTHIQSGAVIGPEASIGLKEGSFAGPTIERNVTIGRRVSILGGIRVGEGATILDNTAVLRDVPPGVTVGGVPAKIIDPT